MPHIRLTLLIGSYAQAFYLGKRAKKTLSDTVRAYQDYLPEFLPTPHPSPRNIRWFKQHPWFEAEVVPLARRLISGIFD
jgi:uracil-DNA glycosylase